MSDSECTLASIEKTSCAFGEYFGNEIEEIHDTNLRLNSTAKLVMTVSGGLCPVITMLKIDQRN